VTLAVDAVVVAGGIFLGRLVARALRQRRQRHTGPEVDAEASPSVDAEASRSERDAEASRSEGDAEASVSEDAEESRSKEAGAQTPIDEPASKNAEGSLPPKAARGIGGVGRNASDALAGFVCRLGDVVVRRLEGDEAWLAGALVFAEERPVIVLFIAPDAGGGRAVLVPGPGHTTLSWLSPIAPEHVPMGGEPPRALEHAGTRFERTRRLPVRVQRLGTGAPRVGASAVIGEYAAAGLERLVVVAGSEAALAWRGVSLSASEYEVLPGGQSTLGA
jgi:hypothetical protein